MHTEISEGTSYMCGTPYYSSSESEMYRFNLVKSDIYSFGIVFCELLYSKEYLFSNYDDIFKVNNGISDDTISFLKLLVHNDPMMRPTVNEIISWLLK